MSEAADQLKAFDALSNEAGQWVRQKIYARLEEQLARFGEEEQARCREVIEDHLRFLRLTLETGDNKPFIDHLNWAHEFFTARLGRSDTLSRAITSLGEFFAANLADGGAQIQHLVQQAVQDIGKSGFKVPCQPGWREAFSFEQAILQGNRKLATGILEDLHTLGHSMLEIDVFVIEPAMNSIGQKWQANEVSIAQEHLATATASTAMAVCFSRFDPMASNGKRVLLACIEKNQHMLGLRMVADVLELNGWDVHFLGADTPVNTLINDIVEFEPDMVGLSVAFVHQSRLAEQIIQKIRTIKFIKPPQIMLGGTAVKIFPNLFNTIGADVCAMDALVINELAP